ncbi:MAG: hypothetical protein KJ915_11585 [Candidatus Omnitrophica bacterium]|nr:hypothetical protein [Candidatus Omnitrophota bacterium]
MENIKTSWPQEKALKHHKIASILIIISAISGLYLCLDDIIILGNNLSAFVFPYLFNYFGLFLSLFQLYTAICFLNKQAWASKAILWIFLIRLLMGYYDLIEVVPVVLVLPYLLFILSGKRLNSLFEKSASDVSA